MSRCAFYQYCAGEAVVEVPDNQPGNYATIPLCEKCYREYKERHENA